MSMTSTRAPQDTPLTPAQPPRPTRQALWLTWVALALIVLLGAYLRAQNLFGWDDPSFRLHPDERFMVQVATDIHLPASMSEYWNSAENPLNPRNANHSFYVYGLLPQTLTRLTAVLLTPDEVLPFGSPERGLLQIGVLQQLLNPDGKNLTEYYQIYKVGRAYSMLFDLGSIVLVFLIGRRLYSRRVGLLAALLMALAVLPIQLAHFFTVDAATAFFTLLTVYWAVRAAQGGGVGSYAALGLSIGAAMACRVTLATLGLLAILAAVRRVRWPEQETYTWRMAKDEEQPWIEPHGSRLVTTAGLLVLAGVLALLTFRVLQPDAFIGGSFFDIRPEPRFIENLRSIAQQISGEQDAPPAQQWTGRTPFLFPLTNMIVWGMGLPFGLAAWAGWAIAGWQLFRRRMLTHLVPWSWIAFYFLWQGGQFVMTMRYYALLYGLLAIFAAWALVALWDRARGTHWRRSVRWLALGARAATALVLIATLCWAYAFTRIYTRPHSRITASRWIYDHIPPGATITSEAWDDGLPLDLDGRRNSEYTSLQTQPYGEDDPTKYTGQLGADGKYNPGLFDQLDQADYIILSSNRVYDSATRLPMRYPALTRYYYYLFNGELGFEQVADIASYPTLFGIPIPDQSAEEAFSVYDHPRVLIFKKTSTYTRQRAEWLIAGDVAWNEVYKIPTVLANKAPTALRLTENQWPEYRNGGTWTNLFQPDGLFSFAPWLPWLLVLELVGLAAFALLFRLFPGLPDRGFALAKTLGLLVVAYGAWLLGSLNLAAFTPASVWLCAGALLLLGAVVGWRARADLVAFVRRKRTALLTAEGLFLLAFFGFLLIRALNPDLWHPARGGEKPMDLAFLTAVLKSPSFPPYDPWFAGGYINYYYFGFVFVGALVHLTGIVPTTAYNLAIPTLFALTALGAWGVAYNLLALPAEQETRRHADTETSDDSRAVSRDPHISRSRQWMRRERHAIVTGIVAAVFVVLLGSLTQAIWFLPGSAPPLDPGQPAECQLSSYAAQQRCRGRSEWAFWDATRVVGMSLQDGTINEFPYFTFLYGDLHAHMIALPLALSALGLMVALMRKERRNRRTKNREPRTEGRWRDVGSWFLALGFLALVIGALRATNTWDFPTYLGLSVVTLALLAWNSYQDGAPLSGAVGRWLLASAGLVLLCVVLFLPFTQHFATDYAGFERWRGTHTSATDFLKINGLWLALLLSAALLLYRRARGVAPLRLAAIGAAVLLLAASAVIFGWTALMLQVPLLGGALGLFVDLIRGAGPPTGDDRERPDNGSSSTADETMTITPQVLKLSTSTLLPVTWALAAIGLTLMTEIVVAKGDIGRMNTVFKLGMQSWVLFAMTSALALTWVWRTSERWSVGRAARRQALLGWAWRSVAALLIVAALVYPLTATPARVADRFDTSIGPTLDGIAYMRAGSWAENNKQFSFAEDADALAWMRQHISGTPIVLEAHTEAYRWGGRVSIYTGLPTLLGWPWHETQQRSVTQVAPVLNSRQSLIEQFYSTTAQSETLQLLRLYGVEYVYVGQLERVLYDPAGLAKFDALASAGQIRTVYSSGETRIYAIPPADHPPAVLTTSLPVHAPAPVVQKDVMLDTPVYQLPALHDFAWNRLADSQPVAVLLWLLACYALLALGLPVAALIFGRWRDGGYAWARLIGLLLLGYAVWMPVSMRLWSYDRLGLLLGALAVLALDAVILTHRGSRLTERGLDVEEGPSTAATPAVGRPSSIVRSFLAGLRDLWSTLKARRRQIVVVEALWLGAFAFMTVLRMFNPDLWQPFWGGEKPFEFGFFNAIVRSPVMPPLDPFFSDGAINYYYYGLFLVSLPVKATGIAPAVAFNLIIPLLFSLTVVGAFALVAQITGRKRFGLVAVAFVAVLGNLTAAFRVGSSSGLDPVRQALAGGLSGFGQRLGDWFVGPSRVIPNTINEFPFWSFLFADLHPHMIAIPITILMIALAYRLFVEQPGADRRPQIAEQELRIEQRGWTRFAPELLAALTLGALAVTNSWDFPTYALLMGGALLGRAWQRRGADLKTPIHGRQRVFDLLAAAVKALLIAAVALLLYMPFFQNYQPLVRGLDRVREGTPLISYLLIYGLFLAVLAPAVFGAAWRLLRHWERRPRAGRVAERPAETAPVVGIVAGMPSRAGRFELLLLVALVALALLLVVSVLMPALALKLWLGAAIVSGLAVLTRRRIAPATWFIVWMAIVAWAVSLGVELVYIRDHLADGDWYRMNTVFKFGLQAWVLLALAAAAMLPHLARWLRRAGLAVQIVAWAVFMTLIGLALIFPIVGTPSRLAYRFPDTTGPTLDGLAFMDRATYDWNGTPINLKSDGEAIQWLNQHIDGTPVVLQSSLEFYRGYGVRVAANTGLPTVISPLHESEQRDGDLVGQRDRDVQQIYETQDMTTALRLLAKYHVGYVYVGPIERAQYGADNVAKFDQLAGSYLDLAYSNDAVKIFKVNEPVYSIAGLEPAANLPPITVPRPAPQPNPQIQPGQPSLEALERQVATNPQDAGPAFGLAQRYRELGQLDRAAEVLKTAAGANPQDIGLHHLWGDILRDAGRFDEAEAAYQAAVDASPTAGNYNKLGSELLKMGRKDRAEAAFVQAIAIDPKMPEPYFHLGEIYEQRGQPDRAIEQYRAYLEIAPADSPFRDQATEAINRMK